MNRRSLALLATVALSLTAACSVSVQQPGSTQAEQPGAEMVIFLVRHAEAVYPPPEEDPRDPPLNAMGQARADALARLLSTEPLDHLWSTDYRRTRETAAPLAARLGVDVESYDVRDLDSFAAQLRRQPGRHVVFGHSNTTAELVAALGGDPGLPIDEEQEFDRLYVLVMRGSGRVTTTLLRYGEPTPENWREQASTRR